MRRGSHVTRGSACGRDSNNNPLKRLLLSRHERELFASGRFIANPNGSGNVLFLKVSECVSE